MTTVDEQGVPPEVSCWRYVGDVERLYMHVPVTVQHGAVIEHAGIPADDGCWEEAEAGAEVTHLPDNTLVNTEPEGAEQPADTEQQHIMVDDHDETVGE
jgi:hypothetical protein